MSTADVVYQTTVNTVVRDFVQRFTSVTDRRRLLKVGRIIVVAVGVVTVGIALIYPGALAAMIAFAFSFITPILVMNFDAWYIRYGTKEAAVVTVLTVVPITTYWEVFSPFVADVNTLWVFGAASFVLFYGCSAIVHVTGPWWTDSVDNAGDQLTGDIWDHHGD